MLKVPGHFLMTSQLLQISKRFSAASAAKVILMSVCCHVFLFRCVTAEASIAKVTLVAVDALVSLHVIHKTRLGGDVAMTNVAEVRFPASVGWSLKHKGES